MRIQRNKAFYFCRYENFSCQTNDFNLRNINIFVYLSDCYTSLHYTMKRKRFNNDDVAFYIFIMIVINLVFTAIATMTIIYNIKSTFNKHSILILEVLKNVLQ